MRGLGVRTGANNGDVLLRVPAEMFLPHGNLERLRFKVLRSNHAIGIWLAEQRAKASIKPDGPWAAWIRSLPDLKDYRDAGLPLAADGGDVRRLANFPEFKAMETWVHMQRSILAHELKRYNAALQFEKASCRVGDDTWLPAQPLTFKEALWGVLTVLTRAFDHGNETYLVPGADLVNYDKVENTRWTFEEPHNDFVLRATRNIKSGEELTCNYDESAGPQDMMWRYGFIPDTGKKDKQNQRTVQDQWNSWLEWIGSLTYDVDDDQDKTDQLDPGTSRSDLWTASSCKQLQALDLDRSPLARNARQLVKLRCPGHSEDAVHSGHLSGVREAAASATQAADAAAASVSHARTLSGDHDASVQSSMSRATFL